MFHLARLHHMQQALTKSIHARQKHLGMVHKSLLTCDVTRRQHSILTHWGAGIRTVHQHKRLYRVQLPFLLWQHQTRPYVPPRLHLVAMQYGAHVTPCGRHHDVTVETQHLGMVGIRFHQGAEHFLSGFLASQRNVGGCRLGGGSSCLMRCCSLHGDTFPCAAVIWPYSNITHVVWTGT
ncbi:hypothetical protein ORF112R [Spotted knifejaw iridovirus]|nr:hypothetical protein ORF112R [Spotted knifejaw iridovirus]